MAKLAINKMEMSRHPGSAARPAGGAGADAYARPWNCLKPGSFGLLPRPPVKSLNPFRCCHDHLGIIPGNHGFKRNRAFQLFIRQFFNRRMLNLDVAWDQ